MSTYFQDIRTALETTLAGLGLVEIWENGKEAAVDGAVRATMIPADTEQNSLGTTGRDLYQGIFQVDVFLDSGSSANSTIPDRVADAFKRGSNHVSNGVTVRIRAASIGAGRKDEGWYIVPVEVQYYAHISARS